MSTHYRALPHQRECTDPQRHLCATHELIYCSCHAGGKCPRCYETNERGETTNGHRTDTAGSGNKGADR
jgi:hypothetical protein